MGLKPGCTGNPVVPFLSQGSHTPGWPTAWPKLCQNAPNRPKGAKGVTATARTPLLAPYRVGGKTQPCHPLQAEPIFTQNRPQGQTWTACTVPNQGRPGLLPDSTQNAGDGDLWVIPFVILDTP